jgi:hypothetical protein
VGSVLGVRLAARPDNRAALEPGRGAEDDYNRQSPIVLGASSCITGSRRFWVRPRPAFQRWRFASSGVRSAVAQKVSNSSIVRLALPFGPQPFHLQA